MLTERVAMRTQSIKAIIRLKEWAAKINEQRASGKSVREWCLIQDISIKTYYYWQNRVRDAVLEAAEANGELARIIDVQALGATVAKRNEQNKIEFVELATPNNKTAVTVHISSYITHIHNGADNETIRCVLTTLAQI